jgi:hypothetical protein
VKGGGGEKEEDADATAALPHAVAPVGAPSVYCCDGERSVFFSGGAEESKGGDWEEKKESDAATVLPHAEAPVGAPSAYSRGGAEKRKGFDGNAAVTCLRTRWRPWERQARRRRGFKANSEVIENRAAARSSAGSVKIECLGAIQ